jgi:hypothetical protein
VIEAGGSPFGLDPRRLSGFGPTIPSTTWSSGEEPVSEPKSGVERPREADSGLRWNAWNLLLLVPFLMLVTPWFNSVEPQLFGMPFFYWAQFAFVPVGVACVAAVYVRTRDDGPGAAGEPADVDELDEGAPGQRGAR